MGSLSAARSGAGGTLSHLLEAHGVVKEFLLRRGALRRRAGTIRAVAGVDLTLADGEVYSLVGESGCGKTTLGHCLLRLVEPTAGRVRFRGEELNTLGRRALRRHRRKMQMVFQDPAGALNPRLRVERLIEEPLVIHRLGDRSWRKAAVDRLLERVELDRSLRSRFPHQLSGGQRQRVLIARALAPGPELVVADEPVAALDASIQAQILELLAKLRRELGLGLLFISHDLAVVERISDRVGVMYLGRIVEEGPVEELFLRPRHPYTTALLSAVPVPSPGGRRRRIVLAGEPPSAMEPPSGCAFHPRCPVASARCASERPRLEMGAEGHLVACHHPGEAGPPDWTNSAS